MNGTEKDNNTSNDSKGSSTLISPSPDFWEDNNGAVTAEIESIKKKREFTKKLFPGFSIAALEKDRIVVSDAINREFIDLGFSTKKSEFICEKDSKSNSCIHARYLYQHEDLPRIYNYFLQRNNAEKVKAVASKLCVGFGVLAGLAGSL